MDLGDYDLESTIDFHFTTRRFSTGAPFTLAGTPALSAYEDNGTTEITAGITLSADFDSRTGLNHVRVAATAANGFESGKSYSMVITTGTVDSVSVVGEVVGRFTIEARSAATPTEVNTQVDTALADIHLDHLLATDYNPASKPGTATALLNELVENDGGVSRFTSNALDEVWADNTPPNGADIAAILTDTAEIGAAGAGLTNIGTIATVTNVTNNHAKYEDAAVWYDDVNGAAGTTSYTHGITTNPSSSEANTGTLLSNLGLNRIRVVEGATFTLAGGFTYTGVLWQGTNWTLGTTGSRAVSNCTFIGATAVSGTLTGASRPTFIDCQITGILSAPPSIFTGCGLGSNTLTISSAGNIDFINCYSIVAGAGAPEVAIPSGTVNVSFRRWSGGLTISGITSGSTISIDAVSGGTITLQGADGTVNVRGMISGVTDSRTGSPTLSTAGAVTVQTQDIQTRLPAALVSGKMDADTTSISGDSVAADRLEGLMDGILLVQVNDGSATSTTFIADQFTESDNDHFNGRLITFVSGNLTGQQTDITDYTGSTQTFTVTALTEAPANDDWFVIH